jgi:hypothetical protein
VAAPTDGAFRLIRDNSAVVPAFSNPCKSLLHVLRLQIVLQLSQCGAVFAGRCCYRAHLSKHAKSRMCAVALGSCCSFLQHYTVLNPVV